MKRVCEPIAASPAYSQSSQSFSLRQAPVARVRPEGLGREEPVGRLRHPTRGCPHVSVGSAVVHGRARVHLRSYFYDVFAPQQGRARKSSRP